MRPLSTVADAIASILANYALGEAQPLERLSGGTTQANYLLKVSTGNFVIRFYANRGADYVAFEIDALTQLSATSFPCQQPIADVRGLFVGEHDHKPFVIFRYIEGEHTNEERNGIQIASAIARMHRLSQPMHFVSSPSRGRYDQQSCLRTAEVNLSSHAHGRAAQATHKWLKDEISHLSLPDGLPVGLCHCDLNPSNFLYRNGFLAAILDFDMASYTHLLYDVANLLYWWANPVAGHGEWQKRTRDLLFAYQAVRALTIDEQEHLYDMFKLVCLMSVSWFPHCPDETAIDQQGVYFLNTLGRDAFQHQIFG